MFAQVYDADGMNNVSYREGAGRGRGICAGLTGAWLAAVSENPADVENRNRVDRFKAELAYRAFMRFTDDAEERRRLVRERFGLSDGRSTQNRFNSLFALTSILAGDGLAYVSIANGPASHAIGLARFGNVYYLFDPNAGLYKFDTPDGVIEMNTSRGRFGLSPFKALFLKYVGGYIQGTVVS